MLLREIKNIFHKELDESYPSEEVDSFFHLLIEHYLGFERFILVMQPELTLTKQEEQPLFEALSELRLQQPIQYIIGTAHFMDMDFEVNENVLIPRPETEELVRWVLEDTGNLGIGSSRYQVNSPKGGKDDQMSTQGFGKDRKNEVRTPESSERFKGSGRKDRFIILDIGTGSGCIAISLAKNLPGTEVHALDVSPDALSVAHKNAQSLNADVTFVKIDILDIEDAAVAYDIMISNPPYVRENEKSDMRKNVTDYEPAPALFVPDDNPLKFYEAIARFARKNLKEDGRLYLEINQYLAKETEALLKNYNFSDIELRKDMFGNQRMIRCTR